MATRKDNGQGSIYFDESKGYWYGEIQWRDSSGKKCKKKFSGKKKTVVKTKLDEFKKQLLLSNGDITKSGVTLREYATNWMSNKMKNALKPTSHQRVDVTLRCQVYPYIGSIPIENIESHDIQNMINCLIDDGKSYSTVKKAYDAVNSCLSAYRIQHKKSGAHNPCDGVKLPIAKKKEVSDIIFYNESERQLIKAEATRKYKNGKPVYRLGEAIVVLMYTGMRIGELLALAWNDIDFDNKTISITKNSVVVAADKNDKNNYKILIQESAKTDSGYRIIPMTEIAKQSLLSIKEVTGDQKYVMSTSNGNLIRARNIERNFNNILKRTKLIGKDDGQCGVHALRHTFASMLFKNGASVKVVSEILGHSDTKITENIYIHLIQEQKVKAISDIDQFSN